jgi:DNA-binding response OmpR family regulator
MTSACPCCGAPVESEWPRVNLDLNVMFYGDRSTHVSPRGAEIMSVLLDKGREYVPAQLLAERVFGRAKITNSTATLAVHITTLRRQLEPMGFTIDVERSYRWRLERLKQAKARRLGRRARDGTK